ncbi:MAG: SUMF1/EgtB/PvdO family nonheme iron enzyme [Planctomycetota bacterium]
MGALVVTFYSYKGGVGRSMALANVATLLVQRGMRVVCADLDLEAPGLEEYLAADASVVGHVGRQPGFIDLVADYQLAMARGPRDELRGVGPQAGPWAERFDGLGIPVPRTRLQPIGVKGAEGEDAPGSLRLLTAGRRGDDLDRYTQRLRQLDWHGLYERWAGEAFMEFVRDDLASDADIVLVDSRTGMTEVGGAATNHWADAIVLLTNATKACVDGSLRMARAFASPRLRALRGGRPLHLLPVAARIEQTAEVDDLDAFRRSFRQQFVGHVSSEVAAQATFLRESEIPYVPHYAFRERLVARDRKSEEMLAAYVTLADTLVDLTSRPVRGSDADGGIFLSYRQGDVDGKVAQLWEALGARFGAESVFWDRDMTAGDHWPERLKAQLQRSQAVVVAMGPGWLRAQHPESGQRRLDMAGDRVREEVAMAIEQRKPMLPVLFEGAVPLKPEWLPDELQPLADRQAVVLDRATWDQGLAELCVALSQRGLQLRAPSSARPAAGGQDGVMAAYRAYLRQSQGYVVSFFPQAGDRLLDDIYVEIHVREAELPVEREQGSTRDREPRTLRALLALAPDPARDDHGAWAVLGEPGAGKSTTARHLCWELAGDPEDPVPVYVPLARLDREGRHPFELAEADLRAARGDVAAAGLAEALRAHAVEPGRLWLVLDGLDEVAPERLPTLRDRILGLRDALPGARVVVLARGVGFQSLPGFREARLLPLEQRAQQRLLQRWLGASDAAELIERLRARPAVQALARNPLLLTLVAWLSLEQPSLPRTRLELYDRAVEALLRKPYGRGVEPIQAPSDARVVLRELALELQASTAAAWTQGELGEALWRVRNANAAINPIVKATWGDNDALLDELQSRTGILAPHEGPRAPWRFLHRQFREFLAAEALAERQRGGGWEEAVGELSAATIPRWSETLGLLCGMRGVDANAVLERLRAADARAAVRALPDVEGVAPERLFAFLWEIGTIPLESGPVWDGVDLARLARGLEWGVGRAAVAEALWRYVVPALDRAALVRLGWVHHALAAIGPVDADRFFAACERPRMPKDDTDYVAVPAGTFVMGSPEDEPERDPDEGPQHLVRVGAFWLARTAVTNAQYARFAPDHERRAWTGNPTAEVAGHPVVAVSWWEARLYCAWLGARLPSEAEWEYACRAGSTTPFSTGTQLSTDDANYDGNHPYTGGAHGEYRERMVPVGSMPPNAWGLHEVHGNVREWCQDTWHDSYEGAPADGAPWESEGSVLRVVRGGSWYNFAWWCRSAARNRWHAGMRFDDVGFRPARSSPPDSLTSSP